MADARFAIRVDLSHLMESHGALLNESHFPALSYAVKAMAEAVHRQWVAYASGAPLPDGKAISPRSGAYARSIQLDQKGPFSAEVFTVLPYAQAIEEGSPARDMKDMLRSSLKVRVTQDGRRYLIIPFRHNNPNSVLGNAMPQAVANWWKAPHQVTSSIAGHGWRDSGTGAVAFQNHTSGSLNLQRGKVVQVRKRTYSWGSRLTGGDLAGMGITGKAADRMAGMVHFRRPQGGHDQYITFRVMMEGSKGWIAPARDGLWPARQTADQFRPIAEEVFAAAVTEDVRAMLIGA